MVSDLAPIILFTYNRPDHLLRCLESLRKNVLADKSILYIYSDGKKPGATEQDIKNIEATRKLIRKEAWCKEVIIVEQSENKGLAASVIEGVTAVVNKHGKIIVLEDDLVFSKHFLSFMNEGLDKYSKAENIYSINGFMFPLGIREHSTFLLPYTSTWGWATWKHRWEAFQPEIAEPGKAALLSNKLLQKRFNLAEYDYVNMLDFKNNSWGIKWYYSVFLRNGLNVFPTVTLVKNNGTDGSGTNAGTQTTTDEFSENTSILISESNQLNLEYFSLYLSHFTPGKKNRFQNLIQKVKKQP